MVFKAKAYAKINFFLDVTGKRSDGYHEIDTIMQSVSIYDEVRVSLTEKDIVVTCDKEELSGDDNIAAKACKAFFETAGLSCGAKIEISKNIPVAAGMGGGSADAAAVLLLLNKAIGNRFTVEELLPVAKSLGADVPFFLIGGAARAQGIGELLTAVRSSSVYMVLLKEGQKQSTGQMYAQLDSSETVAYGDIVALIEALETGDIDGLCANLYNSFTSCWDFPEMCRPFKEFSPKGVFLSGSGPTVGAIFETREAAEICADSLIQRGCNAFYAETVDRGVNFE